MNTIIHIGYPKTATTWLQTMFFPYINNTKYIKKERINKEIIKPTNLNKKELFQKLNITEGEKLILSSIEILGHISDGRKNIFKPKENATRLKKLFPDANIVIFLRNQQELITSSYVQYIKNGGNYSLKKYLYMDNKLFSFDYLKFDEHINLFKDIFGEKNIHVFLFEDFLSNKKLFIQNLKNKLKLDIDLDKIDIKAVNSRYKRNSIPLMRFSNCFIKKYEIVYTHHFMYIPLISRITKYFIRKTNNTFLSGKPISSEKMLGEKNIHYIKNYYHQTNLNLCSIFDKEKLQKYNYL